MSALKIKICGMRRREDIGYINRWRPDYAGFILSGGFKRSVAFDDFCGLRDMLDGGIKAVGVFVNEPLESIARYCDRLDVIQLHGDEDAEYIEKLRGICGGAEIWKAVRAKSPADIETACKLPADKLLIDSFSEKQYGGTGKRVDLEIFDKVKIDKPFFLAGGLTAENVCEAADRVKPYGVDFSSSAEVNGYKDENKIREIIETINNYLKEG